jgi:hypothetical protein
LSELKDKKLVQLSSEEPSDLLAELRPSGAGVA